MALVCRKPGLALHNSNVPSACLLFTVLMSLHPRTAGAQTSNICPTNTTLAANRFYIHDLGGNLNNLGGGRCIDAGLPQSWAAGTQVVINTCNHTVGQEIYVTEIDSSHDVGLSVYPTFTKAPASAHLAVMPPTAAGTTTTGAINTGFCIGVQGGTVTANAALELQNCNASSPAQRFAVDGDAILMGSQTSGTARVTRDFVIERQNGSTVPQTPLVVASRVVPEEQMLRLDARYFRFDVVDGSPAAPTSGFLTVTNGTDLMSAVTCGSGTVVQIAQPLVLTTWPFPGIEVGDGITIRGYRSYTDNGPEIRTCVVSSAASAGHDNPVFLPMGKGVRFTGFRLHGPNGDSRCPKVTETVQPEPAIEVRRDDSLEDMPSVWIDHMEISHWPDAGVFVADPNPNAQPSPSTPPGLTDTPAALAVGSFMHDNVYQVNSGGDMFSQIRANVFYGAVNQPVASREGGCLGGYAATDNLLLPEAPGPKSSDDVDMHGSFSITDPSSWDDGVTGDYFDIGWNTFLRTGGGHFLANVNQRGTSCRFIAIHNNVFLQSSEHAINDPYNPPVEYGPNRFNAQDPTQELLRVGDFDGDRIDDVFLATGAAWYYSSGGQAEWRFLNRASDPASAILLGDFDGDGRTDVLALHGPNIDVSWAGISAWQTINQTAWPLADLAVGDFDGDGRSDLLLTTGTQWFWASAGENWAKWPVSNPDKIQNLRFGHFTDTCGTQTQILRVQKGQWQVTCLSMPSWNNLPGDAPVDSVSGLVAGNFEGNGYTDLAESVPNYTDQTFGWQYTSPGHSTSWLPLFGISSAPVQNLPIGNFQGGKQDGVILWSDNHFYFTHACTPRYPCQQSQLQLLSRQVMR